MSSDAPIVCVKSFNHLPYFLATIVGGVIAGILAFAITQSNGWGQIALGLVIVSLGTGLIVVHYEAYMRTREPDTDLLYAMIIQGFILLCWAAFAIHIFMHVKPLPQMSSFTVTAPAVIEKKAS
jgi:hypothetical protein